MPKETGSFEKRFRKEAERDGAYFDIGSFVEAIAQQSDIEISELDTEEKLTHLEDPHLKAELLWDVYRQVQSEIGILGLGRKPLQTKGYPHTIEKDEKTGKLIKTKGDDEVVFKERTAERISEKFSKNPLLSSKVGLLKALWNDEPTQETFKKSYAKHIAELETVNGDYERYQALSKEIRSLEERLDQLAKGLFSIHKRRSAFEKITLGSVKNQLEERRKEVKRLLEGNPELSAQAAYDELARGHRELEQDGFVWLSSRREKLEELEARLLSGRPIMIMSESGAGKTSIVNAAARIFTDQRAAKGLGGQDVKSERLFVRSKLKGDESYYEYQPLLAALSGKSSSLEKKPTSEGRFFLLDEFNELPRRTQMEIIKALSGNMRAGDMFEVPNINLREKVQKLFAFIVAGNPASARYDREPIDPAVKREFAGNILELDYLEQTKENPELYKLLLIALMDENRRIRAAKEEIAPEFEIQGTGDEVLVDKPKAGGFLWRFSNCWREMLNAFKHEQNILTKENPADESENYYFEELPVDIGMILGWVREYKIIGEEERTSIEQFMSQKIKSSIMENPELPDTDKELASKFFAAFDIYPNNPPRKKVTVSNLTPQEIGWLLPSTERPRRTIDPDQLEREEVVLEDGTVIEFHPYPRKNFAPGEIRKMGDGKKLRYLGFTIDDEDNLQDLWVEVED